MDWPKLTNHKSAVKITHHHDVPEATDSSEIISHDEHETVAAPADALQIISHGTTTANYWPIAQIYSEGENFSL
jgi:hypothetical protein